MRYFIGFLIVIGLVVLVFVLFLTGGPSTPKSLVPSLPTYADTNTVVQLTIDGPINADQTHRQVQIIVGQNESEINVFQGYDNTVLNNTSFPSNENAYDAFLHAIDIAGFTKTRKTSNTDDTGVCALGDRYIYEIINGATDLQRTWSTSCGGQGTFGGNTNTILTLFQDQIPNYDQVAGGVVVSPLI
jgi:hypothetical protein